MIEGLRMSNKIVHLEFIRIVAAVMVVFNHTEYKGYLLYSKCSQGSVLYWIYMALSILCKAGVPLFFCISGALLLGREKEGVKVYFKRIVRTLIVLLFFSIIYYLYLIIPVGGSFDLKAMVTMIYTGTIAGHLWFMYAYLAFLISLPLLQAMAQNLDKWVFAVCIILSILFDGLIPIIQFYVFGGKYEINGMISPFFISSVVLYPLIGYYVHNRMDEGMILKYIPWLWVGNVACFAITEYVMNKEASMIETGVPSEKFISVFSVVNCITLFVSLKKLIDKISVSDLSKRIICTMGACTFGIYLMHPIIIDSDFIQNMYDAFVGKGINAMVAAFIITIITFLISGIITYIILQIPGLRIVVGGKSKR